VRGRVADQGVAAKTGHHAGGVPAHVYESVAQLQPTSTRTWGFAIGRLRTRATAPRAAPRIKRSWTASPERRP